MPRKTRKPKAGKKTKIGGRGPFEMPLHIESLEPGSKLYERILDAGVKEYFAIIKRMGEINLEHDSLSLRKNHLYRVLVLSGRDVDSPPKA